MQTWIRFPCLQVAVISFISRVMMHGPVEKSCEGHPEPPSLCTDHLYVPPLETNLSDNSFDGRYEVFPVTSARRRVWADARPLPADSITRNIFSEDFVVLFHLKIRSSAVLI